MNIELPDLAPNDERDCPRIVTRRPTTATSKRRRGWSVRLNRNNLLQEIIRCNWGTSQSVSP
jgi:hypothetical protein